MRWIEKCRLLAATSVAVSCLALAAWGAAAAPADGTYRVERTTMSDRKAVFGTVESTDQVPARARIGGTLAELTVDEGSEVNLGEVIAVVGDPKLSLRMKSLDANIQALEARLANAKNDLDRAKRLIDRGVISEARLDQLQTTYDVTRNELISARADHSVIKEQMSEGEVLAPAKGRVLQAPLTEGSVVMAGETIATIAAANYILRLQLPERHARFMQEGEEVLVGERGLRGDDEPANAGKIVKVYPKLEDGRVIADAEVDGLGGYFVGERALVWVSVGEREAFVVPRSYIFQRYGQDYVRLKRGDGTTIDVVVQTGQPASIDEPSDAVEVLAGLEAGDELVKP